MDSNNTVLRGWSRGAARGPVSANVDADIVRPGVLELDGGVEPVDPQKKTSSVRRPPSDRASAHVPAGAQPEPAHTTDLVHVEHGVDLAVKVVLDLFVRSRSIHPRLR